MGSGMQTTGVVRCDIPNALDMALLVVVANLKRRRSFRCWMRCWPKLRRFLRNRKIVALTPDDSAHLVPTDGVLRGAPGAQSHASGMMAHLALFTGPRHAAHIVAGKFHPRPDAGGQALLAQQAVSILACDAEQCQARVQDGQHSYRVTLAEQSTCECGTDNQGGCAHMALAATQRRRG